MSDNTTRQDKINGIRALADFLEANPDVTLPYNVGINLFVEMAEARDIRKGTYGWRKEADGNYFQYIKDFCPELGKYNNVSLNVYVPKSEDTCKRVQTGTRTVEAVEAHEEPIYEWVCGPDADAIPE